MRANEVNFMRECTRLCARMGGSVAMKEINNERNE